MRSGLNFRPAAKPFVTYWTSVETLTRTYTATEENLVGRTLTAAGRELVDRGSEGGEQRAYLLNALDGDGSPRGRPDRGRAAESSIISALRRQIATPDTQITQLKGIVAEQKTTIEVLYGKRGERTS